MRTSNTRESVRRMLQNRGARTVVALLVLAVGILYACRSGLGPESNHARHLDARYVYTYGAAVRDKLSPYRRQNYKMVWERELGGPIAGGAAKGVALLPSLGPFAATWALIGWNSAKGVYDALNILLGLGGTLVFTALLTRRTLRRRDTWPGLWVGLAAVCMIGGVPGALFVGQPTLWAMAGVLGAIEFSLAKKLWPAALCVLVASLKMPIVILPLLYLFCLGYYGPILLGSLLTVAFSAVTLLRIPLDGFLPDLKESLNGYGAVVYNRPPFVTGLPGLIGSPDAAPATVSWLLAGMLVTAAMALLDRRKFGGASAGEGWLSPEQLSLGFVVTGAFVPLKPYDMVIFGPLLCVTLASGVSRRLLYLPGLILVANPDRLVRRLEWFPISSAQLASIGALWLFVALIALHFMDSRGASRAPAPVPGPA